MLGTDRVLLGTGNDEVLEPLRKQYNAQHYRLVKFYYECSNLRYLTSLLTVPKLPQVIIFWCSIIEVLYPD